MKLILCYFLLASSAIYCQSEFIGDNDFGFGGGYTVANNNISSSNGLDFAFTFINLFDFGFQYSSADVDVENSDSNIESSLIFVYLGYNIKKRDNAFILKPAVGYLSASVGRTLSSKTKVSGPAIGIGFYPRVVNTSHFELRAAIELLYGFLSGSNNQSFSSGEDSKYYDTRSLSLGISAGFFLTENVNLVLAPFVSKDLVSSESSFAIGFMGRLVLGFKVQKQE
jgi:hypothetical protein